MRSCSRQYFEFIFEDVNTVSEYNVRACQPNLIQILDVGMPGLQFDDVDFLFVFGGVGMNDYVALGRDSSNSLEQFARATESEARSETVTNSPVRLTVPLLHQIDGFSN